MNDHNRLIDALNAEPEGSETPANAPQELDSFVGQTKLRENLNIAVNGRPAVGTKCLIMCCFMARLGWAKPRCRKLSRVKWALAFVKQADR